MHIISDQDINEIVKTENKISVIIRYFVVSINNLTDWWLEDPKNQYFKAAEQAIEQSLFSNLLELKLKLKVTAAMLAVINSQLLKNLDLRT
ncbi:12116_t:CDS:2 [Funneliformis geosporum]|nr:12116_t:CDS:2 [Funneliformis geosporum]